jgi:hypothetical protein
VPDFQYFVKNAQRQKKNAQQLPEFDSAANSRFET